MSDVKAVLVVEDEGIVRSLLIRLLMHHGFAVDAAPDGAAAMERLREPRRYAAIVLDLTMPRASGADVLEFLIRTDPRMVEKTVVVTGYPGVVSELGLGKVCEVLIKPVEMPQLLGALGRCLEVKLDAPEVVA